MKKKDKLKILLIGSAFSSKILLKKCISLKLNIVGVCTKKSSKNFDFCNLKSEFKNTKLKFKYVNDINSSTNFNWIKDKRPDLIFCFGWSQILSKKIINIPKLGTIGFHPTELPKNRGRHPIIWSLALGLKQTASSFFVIKNEIPDSGKIISQRKIRINNHDNAYSLYLKIMKAASLQLNEIVKRISSKLNLPYKNNKFSNHWRKRDYSDGMIDWRMTAVSINNLVRALDKPYMHPHFYHNDKEFKIFKSKIILDRDNIKIENIEPGKILSKSKSSFDVKCGSGILRVLKVNRSINLNRVNYL